MHRRTNYLPLIVACLFVFISINLSAQVHAGFRKYRKGQSQKAAKKFQKALRKSRQQPVASLGLAYLYRKSIEVGDYWTLDSTYQVVRNAQQQFEAFPEKWQNRYKRRKKTNISIGSFKNYCGRLQKNALSIIEAHDSILLLDTFITYMVPVEEPVKKYFTLVEDTVTINTFFESKDYEALKSVVKNHMSVLEKRKLRISPSYEIRLKNAFLDEYPLTEYRRHVQNFPGQRYTDDCHMDYFLESVETGKLDHIASFLDFCMQSNMDDIVVDGLARTPSHFLLNQLDSLTKEERHRIEEVIKTKDWLYNDAIPDKGLMDLVDVTIEHLKDIAPSNRAYRILLVVLENLHNQKAWNRSLDLLKRAQPLFPDLPPEFCRKYALINKKEIWFEKMIAVFSVKATKPEMAYLTEINEEICPDDSPVVSVDQHELLFSSDYRASQIKARDVFTSYQKEDNWSEAVLHRNLSGRYKEKPLAMSADRTKLLVSVNNRLYLSERKLPQNNWSEPKAFAKAFYDIVPWMGNATLSRDGKVIIFEGSMDERPIINESDIDLYLMEYDVFQKTWSTPYPIARGINSIYQERTPFLHADNRTLFFSSKAHYGLADLDWFKSERLGEGWNDWSEPVNMGKEHNSFKADWTNQFSMVASGKSTYSANNNTPTDIFQQEISPYYRPTRVIAMNGRLIHREEGTQIKTYTQYPTAGVQALDSCQVFSNKSYQLLVPDIGQEVVYLYADDPLIYSTVAQIKRADLEDVMNIPYNPITRPVKDMISLGLPIPTEHLFFEAGSAVLSPEAKQELDWVAQFFQNRKLIMLVSGYTYEEGTEEVQAKLSLARAETVKTYLQAKGLTGDFIWSQGFADRYPKEVKSNESVEKRNRRVQIFIKSPQAVKH